MFLALCQTAWMIDSKDHNQLNGLQPCVASCQAPVRASSREFACDFIARRLPFKRRHNKVLKKEEAERKQEVALSLPLKRLA